MHKFKIRTNVPEDMNFIYSTWNRGYYHGGCHDEPYDPEYYSKSGISQDFFKKQTIVIDNILSRPSTTVSMCCFEDDPDVILGYSVTEPKIIHWIFVKESWRKLGIAKSLYPEGIKYYTHLTLIGKSLKHKLKLEQHR